MVKQMFVLPSVEKSLLSYGAALWYGWPPSRAATHVEEAVGFSVFTRLSF